MSIEKKEKPYEPVSKLKRNPPDRFRRDSRRRDLPTAEVYAHPSYVPQLREMIKAKMEEFRAARTQALAAIDQRIHEVAHLKHRMDPAAATELMVTLAEARAVLLSLNPTAAESEETLTEVSGRLQAFVKKQRAKLN